MYDDLSAERIEKYEKAVNYFSPDPRYCCLPNRFVSTAANRLSMCMVVGLRGIIVKDPYKTRLASDSLNDVFGYVTSGDGFYRDGSFIQHDRHPYNGGYGVGMISDLSEIIYLLGESSYKVTSNGMDNVYDWIYKGYAPLMYHGIIMDAVTGRAASRSYNSTYCAASMLKAVLMLSAEADAENSAKLKSIAKTWITENTLGNLYTDSGISIIKMMNELMADGTVGCAAVSEGNFQYAGMDRVVHNRKKYSFAVSMWSDRIYNYESILGENLKGWHTADGMTYLYNGDMTQYTENFWPTINPKRLPGTTAADADLADGEGASSLSSENRTGGASLDGMYGNACMALDGCGSGLKAKKSWFMFDDEIVALGADITNTEKTETVIDNRKLNSQGGGTLTADGKTAAEVAGEEEKLQNTKWLHLSGINADSDVGYYLFDGADVNVLRENRAGSWQQINKSNANTYCSNSFMNLVIDHGTKPAGETYAYALLPGKSASETKSYAENPAVEIIKNDAAVQAVKNTALSVTGAVFWTDSVQTADKITCNKKASVMLRESNGELSFGISDPTQKNDGTIEITYDGAAGNVISCDDEIKVLSVYPKVTLSVNTANTHGRTLNIKLKKSSRNFINPDVLIDKNISVSGNGTYTVSGLGNVQFRAWTVPMSSITSTGDTFTITQQRKSMYKDNIQLASSKEISCRTPTVINIRYRVNAAAENTEEEAALSLYIPGVTNWKAGTGQIKLDKHSDEYKNLILLIKPDEKKIYYSSDGTTVQTAAFDGEMTQDAAEVRLYTIAKPDSSMSVAGDGTAELRSAVIWEFDRIEISPYVDDGKHIRFSSFNSGKMGGNIGYTAELVNICAFPQRGTAAVAVYDADGTLAGVSIEDTGSIKYNERKIISGTVDVNKTDTTVKAFIWNNMNEMIPYDTAE